jgi:hypothetical protein
MLFRGGGYSRGCLVNSPKAAEILELQYDGKTLTKPNFICVAETHDLNNGRGQHFFVFLPIGGGDYMLDPWEKPDKITIKPLTYNIVSYRLFHERKIYGVGEWWSGERPSEFATRDEIFSSFASKFEAHLKKTYNIDKINDILNGK